MAQTPKYKLQLLVPDPEKSKSRQQALVDKAREAFRGKDKRVPDLIRQSNDMLEYDLYGAVSAAEKAEKLARETSKDNPKDKRLK